MSLRSGIQIASIVLAATFASATPETLNFQDLMVPKNSQFMPLDNYGGCQFTNVEVMPYVEEDNSNDGFNNGFMDMVLGPGTEEESCNIAFVDPAEPAGCSITASQGDCIQSIDFMCCSNKKGESILEGYPCKAVACKVNAKSTKKVNGKKTVIETQEFEYIPPTEGSYGSQGVSAISFAEDNVDVSLCLVDENLEEVGLDEDLDVSEDREVYPKAAKRALDTSSLGWTSGSNDAIVVLLNMVLGQ